VALDPVAPRSFNRDPDPDPRTGGNGPDGDASVFDGQLARGEIEAVVLDGDAERLGQVAGTATEIVLVDRAAIRRTALRHQLDSVEWLQRTNQHGAGIAVRLRDRVHQIVNAVVQIHVRKSRRPEERLASGRPSERRVTRRIVLADVGLRFDDHARRSALARAVHEHCAQQVFRDA